MENLITDLINSSVEFKIAALGSFAVAVGTAIWFAINTNRHNAKYKNRQSR